jgi:hypothetical protein
MSRPRLSGLARQASNPDCSAPNRGGQDGTAVRPEPDLTGLFFVLKACSCYRKIVFLRRWLAQIGNVRGSVTGLKPLAKAHIPGAEPLKSRAIRSDDVRVGGFGCGNQPGIVLAHPTR